MTICSDRWIKSMCVNDDESAKRRPMIQPFVSESISVSQHNPEQKIPSYGLSSYGYDVRLGRNFKVFTSSVFDDDKYYDICRLNKSTGHYHIERYVPTVNHDGPIDVLSFSDQDTEEFSDVDSITIPPGGFVLGHTVERIIVPPDVSVVCMGKSTIARCGILVIVTPLEAGWEGYTTLEIANLTPRHVRLHSGIGITQMQFFQGKERCMTSYADRGGKYQNQEQTPITARL